jgi:hypothetical protein
MATACDSTLNHLLEQVGNFSCYDANPLVRFRNPLHLTNWTLPIIELLIIGGAVLAFVHSLRRYRRHNDPTCLAVWIGSLAYLVVSEIPLYFPKALGLPASVSDVFAHNAFTVQFLYDRLPLYIVALYPAVACLAYEITRSLGLFRRNVVLGSICAGFIYHVFYELFDQLGPQLKWWIWNPNADTNHPFFSAVPMTSMVIFATLMPGALTLFVRLLVARPTERGAMLSAWQVTWRALVAGVLVPIAVSVVTAPVTALGTDQAATKKIIFAVCLAAFAAVAITMCIRQVRGDSTVAAPRYAIAFAAVYLATFLVLWATALPAYLDARSNGVTHTGSRIGSLPYAIGCWVLGALGLWAMTRTSRRRSDGEQFRDRDPLLGVSTSDSVDR